MTKSEAVNLFRWLAISFPKQYGNLSDEEVQTIVDNLAWCFRFNTYTDVLQEYRNAYTRQKTAPHPSEIANALKTITPAQIGHGGLIYDCHIRLQKEPEYWQLCKQYGERYVYFIAKDCVETATIGELKWRIGNDQWYEEQKRKGKERERKNEK